MHALCAAEWGTASVKIRVSRGFWTSVWGLSLLGLVADVFLTDIGVFTYYCDHFGHFGHMIDARLSAQVCQTSARIYAAPERTAEGETMSPAEMIAPVERSGFP